MKLLSTALLSFALAQPALAQSFQCLYLVFPLSSVGVSSYDLQYIDFETLEADEEGYKVFPLKNQSDGTDTRYSLMQAPKGEGKVTVALAQMNENGEDVDAYIIINDNASANQSINDYKSNLFVGVSCGSDTPLAEISIEDSAEATN